MVNPVNGGWLGEGGGLSRAGIPTIGYIPQPSYLCAGPDNCEIDKLSGEGLALGIEIKQAFPPEGRVVVVLPKLGTGQPNLIRLLNDLRAKAPNAPAPAEIKEERIEGRTVYHVSLPMVSLGWWNQAE